MINLYNYKGFCAVHNDTSYEFKTVYHHCFLNNIPFIKVKNNQPCPNDYIPTGSVEWCILSLNKSITPNYYPNWLSNHLYRKVWKSDKWILNKKLFVKPADKHKRFNGFCTHGTYSKKKKPPYWYSDIVHFSNEWRYYITKGKIICAHWYYGDEINTPDAPKLNIYIPNTFSGTLDFGTINNNTLALVEAHEPIGCGWYGRRDDCTYLQWIIDGWIYMKQIK